MNLVDQWSPRLATAASRQIHLGAYINARRFLTRVLPFPEARLFVAPNCAVPWPLLGGNRFMGEIVSDPAGMAANFYNLYRIAPDHLESLIRRASRIRSPTTEDLIEIADVPATDPIYAALLWFMAAKGTIAAPLASDDGSPELEKNRDRSVVFLHRRLARVSFEGKDLADTISLYDSPETFFFIDQRSLSGELSREDLAILLAMLPELKGRILLLLYDMYDAAPFAEFHLLRTRWPWSPWIPTYTARTYV